MRDRMFPLAAKLVQRAKDAGDLREDFQAEDVPMLLLMLIAILDCARDVAPELWHRYVEVVIQGLRADPTPPEPLPTPALDPAEILPRVMASFKLPRR
jgi:hypothetical protein